MERGLGAGLAARSPRSLLPDRRDKAAVCACHHLGAFPARRQQAGRLGIPAAVHRPQRRSLVPRPTRSRRRRRHDVRRRRPRGRRSPVRRLAPSARAVPEPNSHVTRGGVQAVACHPAGRVHRERCFDQRRQTPRDEVAEGRGILGAEESSDALYPCRGRHRRPRRPENDQTPYSCRASRGADDGIRTRDPHLGKVMLYQLSHVRVRRLR